MIKRSLKILAQKQCGYFTPQQAIRAGYVKTNHSYHVSHSNWLHIDRGVFRLPGFPDTLESEFVKWSLWATCRMQGRWVAIGYESALHYYQLSAFRPQDTHLVVPASDFHKEAKAGCTFHREELGWGEVIQKKGFHLTTPRRTLSDMKASLMMQSRWLDTTRLAVEKSLIAEEDARDLLGEALYRQMRCAAGSWATPVLSVSSVRGNDGEAGNIRWSVRMPTSYDKAMSGLSNGAGLRARNRSFTLVELLVVIAIMSILVSLLMPALSSAMHGGRGVVCRSNLHQLNLAITGYAADHQNVLPYACYGTTASQTSWGYALQTYCNQTFFWYPAKAGSPGQLGVFNCPENAIQIYSCSVDSSMAETGVSYGANGWSRLGPSGDAWDGRAMGARLQALSFPSKLCVLRESTGFRYQALWQDDGANSIPALGFGAGWTRYAHDGASQILYADGHVGALNLVKGLTAYLGGPTYSANTYSNGAFWFASR